VPRDDIAPPSIIPSLKIKTLGRRNSPHEDLYHFILDRTWPQYIAMLIGTFLVLNVLFAFIYYFDPSGIVNARAGSLEDCFYFSVQTLATIGFGQMAPADRFTNIVVVVEAVTGTLSIALIAGVTFAKFARPTAKVLFAAKALVTPRDGVPHLMFRMANWRHNQVFDARLKVVLLVASQTREGEIGRLLLELPLVRDSTALFAITWTAMHRIDEQSPFYGPDAIERLRAAGAQLFLTLSGVDETIGQTINARWAYDLDDIVWNARFADVISFEPDGTRVVDYREFHRFIPLAADDAAIDR
jgi:inward rectifier potassium channel